MPDVRPTSVALLSNEARAVLSGGPGSGKTSSLIDRFVSLVAGGADPERVVLFSPTRRGARFARAAILQRLRRPVADLPVTTVHGFAFGVLRGRFESLGYDEAPDVLSAGEQRAVVAELLASEALELWPGYASVVRSPAFARDMATLVLRAQEQMVADTAARDGGIGSEALAFVARYLAAIGDAGRIDFAGLVQQTASLLARSPEGTFDHVLADDVHEMTPAQAAVIAALGARARSLVVAADPGAREVPRELDGLAAVELGASHRSGGRLAAVLDGLEEPVDVAVEARLFAHPGEEVEGIARELLRARVDDDVAWHRMAVIVRRRGTFASALRHALARHGIPHVFVGDAPALETDPAVRPLLDLFRYALEERGRDERLETLLVSPVAGFTPHEVRRLRREARVRDVGLRELVEQGAELPAELHERVVVFRALVLDVAQAASDATGEEIVFATWERLPWYASLVASADAGDEGANRALDAFAAFAAAVGRFTERHPGAASVGTLLELVDASGLEAPPVMGARVDAGNDVRVVTPRQAQGLEFDVVLVANCLDGEFPAPPPPEPLVSLEAILDPVPLHERRRRALAQERRLFRLAVSRARSTTILCASAASTARMPRTPSPYASLLGASWAPVDTRARTHTDVREIEAALRRTLADRSAPPVARLAALAALPRTGADPSAWWTGRDWTDPGVALYADGVRTSYSRLAPLDNCALQFLFQTEMGLDTRETHQMWLGTVVHSIIERVHAGELPRDPVALHAALDAAWRPEIFGTKAVEHRRYLDARDMLDRWLSQSDADPIAAEAAFEFDLDDATVRGRIDAIFPMANGHVRVVDYKTGRTRHDEAPEEDLQLAAYHLAMQRAESLREFGAPGVLELHFIAQPRVRDGYAQVRFQPATVPGYEENAVARITSLLQRMREESFAPSAEADCMWCRFKTLCPLWPEGAEATAG